MMQFKGFRRVVKKLAKGRYHCARHQVTEYSSGRETDEWDAYIAGVTWTTGHSTPEEALTAMEALCSDLE